LNPQIHQALDLAALPGFAYSAVHSALNSVWPVQVSHLAVGAYEAPLGAGPPASFVIAGPGLEPGGPAL